MLRIFTLLFFAAIVAGCSSVGPVSSPDFPQLVAKGVPQNDGEIHFYGNGTWYPNTRGFTAIRSSLFSPSEGHIPGILVVTTSAVLFQQWEEKTKELAMAQGTSHFRPGQVKYHRIRIS